MRNRAQGNLKHYLRNYVTKGTTLPAGEYEYREGSIDYTLTIEREISYLGEVDLTHPDADTHQLLECLATYDKENMYIPAGDCLIPIEKPAGGFGHLYFMTPYAIGTRFDKYHNPVCDLIDTDDDNCLGDGVYRLLGSVKYRFQQTPGYKFEPDGEKSIAKVSGCLPDTFFIPEEFQAALEMLSKYGLKFTPSRKLELVFQLIQLKMDSSADDENLNDMFSLFTGMDKFSNEALLEIKAAIELNQLRLGSDAFDFETFRTVLNKILPTLSLSVDNLRVAKEAIKVMVDHLFDLYESKVNGLTERVIKEYSLSLACPDLRARKPLFSYTPHARPIACQLMRKMPGVDLLVLLNYEYLAVDHPKYRKLSLDDCLQIALASFRSLKHQMHDNGLVHRDLKPDNMMVDQQNGRWIVNIIDTGLSRFAHTQDNRSCGNIQYAAPEIYLKQSVLASDVYSMAKVLSYLIAGLIVSAPQPIQLRVVALLNRCMQVDVNARPTLPNCINELTSICFDYKKLTLMIPQDQHDVADKGFNLGKEAAVVLMSTAAIPVSQAAIADLLKRLHHIIDQLPDNSFAIQAFHGVIDVQCLHGLTDKAVLKNEVTDLTELFFQRYDELKSLRETLHRIREQARQHEDCPLNTDFGKAVALDGHIQQLEQFIADNIDCPAVLDVMSTQATHFYNKSIKCRAAIKYFSDLLPAQPDNTHTLSCRK